MECDRMINNNSSMFTILIFNFIKTKQRHRLETRTNQSSLQCDKKRPKPTRLLNINVIYANLNW